MTSLGIEIIKGKTNRRWIVTREVSGDLSFSYRVRPRHAYTGSSFIGLGIGANKLSDVDKIISLANKYGYDKAWDIWDKTHGAWSDYRYGYLRGRKAKEYARYAYGDYAEKIKKRTM